MTDEVYRFIEREKLIERGDTVVVGVSGGADSICLLLLLLAYQKQLASRKQSVSLEQPTSQEQYVSQEQPTSQEQYVSQEQSAFAIRVVHVEHGIRGEESTLDARFVEEFCAKREIPCQTFYLDVPSYAKEQGLGIEEAARILRYDCFQKAAETIADVGETEIAKNTADVRGTEPAKRATDTDTHIKIALAHHADDNAETMLFQMARGSGVKGLCGIRAKRMLNERVAIIRPLLMVTRAEIEPYLQEIGQEFCVDSTNQDTDYSRNRIRHEVIPELEKINAQAVVHMTQAAGMLTELSDYLTYEVERILPEVSQKTSDGSRIKTELFTTYPMVLQKEVIHRTLGEVAGSRKDIGSVHVESVLGLVERQVGRRISLPYQMEAVRDYEGICIRQTKNAKKEYTTIETISITQEQLKRAEAGDEIVISLPDGEMRLRVRDFCGEIGGIQKKRYTKWLNYDKIKCGLLLRKRASGDYFTIDGQGHRKKLKDYFIGEKIPSECRDKIWLLAEGAHVLWIVGGRISADYRIESDTKKILEVQIKGGDYCEDQED